MKLLLLALNSKYIHSSLGIYSLSKYCQQLGAEIVLQEYTVHEPLAKVLAGIAEVNPQLLGISCNIWNIEENIKLIQEIKKILPNVLLLLGGPEVLMEPLLFMRQHPQVDYIITGEGELPLKRLLQALVNKETTKNIPNLAWRAAGESGYIEKPLEVLALDEIPFAYDALLIARLKNKIIYYESSRGCPFQCSYCLSSISHKVRFLSMERLAKDIEFFIAHKVPQVKFVDRTFNCSQARTKEVLGCLLQYQDQPINFHFEIAVDLLDEGAMDLIASAPKGFFQLEIGIQTIIPAELAAIKRSTDIAQIASNIAYLQRAGNCHLHVDLIAGLPLQTSQSFLSSLEWALRLGVECVQLGFLKVLTGAPLRRQADIYQLQYLDSAPYEIISTAQMSFLQLAALKELEQAVDLFYNKQRLANFWRLFLPTRTNAVACFAMLAQMLKGEEGAQLSVAGQFKFIVAMLEEMISPAEQSKWLEILCYDWRINQGSQAYPAALQKREAKIRLEAWPEITSFLQAKRSEQPGCYKNVLAEHFKYTFIINTAGNVVELKKELSIMLFDCSKDKTQLGRTRVFAQAQEENRN